ncbi:hypothetical protein B0A55_06915 [Friedmanniomyces simplex]|uniref:Uncharacterized protein n=1 Tax=Friedmanniomyces simplex TaxID=329884 RepID=A0A4U0X9J2_9PEZI|nr:hypothetical protein B0A55_06915 [Friedmanniomyces simplex]
MAYPLNCTSDPNAIVTADSDILGPGVLAAFFATAFITLVAVLFAYVTDALDDDLLNELDRKVIADLSRLYSWRPKRPAQPNATSSESDAEASKELRKEAIAQFILALSDQQLVTGLAILIAAVSEPDRLTGYEFGVVLSLAWFSSITHLATLDALRSKLGSLRRLRDARVAGMLAVLVLLIYTLVISTVAEYTVPVGCLFRPSNGAYGWGFCSVTRYTSVGLVLALIIIQYAIRLQDLYTGERDATYFISWTAWKLRRQHDSTVPPAEQLAEHRAALRLQNVNRIRYRTSRRWLKALYLLSGSYLSTLSGLAFSFSYGLMQIVSYRWLYAPTLPPGTNRIGFGQLVTLLLLCLPFLTARESYHDYRARKHDEKTSKVEEAASSQDSTYASTIASFRTCVQGHLSRDQLGDDTLDHDQLDDDILDQEVDLLYDRQLPTMQKYFRKEARTAIEEASGVHLPEMLQRKRQIVNSCKAISSFRKDISTPRTALLFGATLILWLAIGIALNFDDWRAVLAACAMLCLLGSSGLALTIFVAVGPVRKEHVGEIGRAGGAVREGGQVTSSEMERSETGARTPLSAQVGAVVDEDDVHSKMGSCVRIEFA